MITGFWKGVTLIRGNPFHEENQEMYIREISLEEEKARDKKAYLKGKPDYAFYCCPKNNPDAREEDELACFNRISVAEMEKAINMICDKIENDEEECGTAFIKNYKFETKAAEYKVLESKEDRLVLQVLAKKARKREV